VVSLWVEHPTPGCGKLYTATGGNEAASVSARGRFGPNEVELL